MAQLPFRLKSPPGGRQPSSVRVLGLAWLVVFAFAMTCLASAMTP